MKKKRKGGSAGARPAVDYGWMNRIGAVMLLLLFLSSSSLLQLATPASAALVPSAALVGKAEDTCQSADASGPLALSAAELAATTNALVGTKEGERQVYVVATADGRVYGVEGSTGEQLWSFHSGRALFSGSSQVGAARSDDPLLIPGRDGSLYAYITSTGMLKKLPSSIKDMVNNSPFLAADGTLFVGSKDSQIFTLELDTGNLASVHSTKGLSTQLVPTNPDDDDDDKNANQLFVMRTDYTVRAINHKSGEERWNVTVSEFTSDALEDSNITLLASLNPNGVHAVDMNNGLRLWNMKFPSPVVAVYQVAHDPLVRRAFLRTLRTPFVISHKHFLHSVSSPNQGADGVFIVEHEGRLIAFPDPKVIYHQDLMLPGGQRQTAYSLPAPEDVHGDRQHAQSPGTQLVDPRHPLFDDDDDDEHEYDHDDELGRSRANNSIVLDDGKVCLVKGLHFIEKSTRAEPDEVPLSRPTNPTEAPRLSGGLARGNGSLERIASMLDALGIGMASVISSVLTMASMGLVMYIYTSARRVQRSIQEKPSAVRTAAATTTGSSAEQGRGGKRSRRKAGRSARKNAEESEESSKMEDVENDDDGQQEAVDDESEEEEGSESDEGRRTSEEQDENTPRDSGRAARKKRTLSKKGTKAR